MRVRHNRNALVRFIYFILLFVVYRELFFYTKLSLNLAMYMMFLLLFLGYYLAGTMDFTSKYRKKNILYSSIFNLGVFAIFYFFYKNPILIGMYVVYTIIQVLLNYIFYSKGEQKLNTLVLNSNGEKVESIRETLEKTENYNYVGYLSREEKKDNVNNRLGDFEVLTNTIKKYKIKQIVFTKDEEMKKISNKLMDCKLKGIKIVDYLGFLEELEGKIDVDKIDSLWFVMSDGFDTLSNNLQKKIKRVFDWSLGFLLFICFIPFMLVTYILVKLDVGVKYIILNPKKIIKNPAFFKQKRIGFKGKEFEIIKFRSMKIHNPDDYSKYAGEKDDRITKIGNFIRKTRLDELPQIINVLKGDMSFIGPRPEWDILGRDYETKINNYKIRYSVRPGVTGWAQVMYPYGASVEDAKHKLEYDLYYIKYQNLYLDLIIMFKTIQIVIFGKGR